MRTYVYVDGFNLYYGALKGTAWKWLDLPTLFAEVLQPHHDILAVKYFTARVSGTPVDQSKPQRQDVYLRALQHHRHELAVYFGHFLRHTVRAPLAHPLGSTRTAEVIKTEEKGSDAPYRQLSRVRPQRAARDKVCRDDRPHDSRLFHHP